MVWQLEQSLTSLREDKLPTVRIFVAARAKLGRSAKIDVLQGLFKVGRAVAVGAGYATVRAGQGKIGFEWSNPFNFHVDVLWHASHPAALPSARFATMRWRNSSRCGS